MDSLNRYLKEEAVRLGLCNKWKEEWKQWDDFELVEKFKKGMDFCIKHDFPSLDVIRQNFNPELLAMMGVFIDGMHGQDGRQLPSGVYVCLGDCEGELSFGRWAAAMVYVRHSSRVKVSAAEFTKVSVRLYDDSECEISEAENAEVRVFDRRR